MLLKEDGSGEYRSVSKPELRLFPTEFEICAIYHALQKFRSFVFNRKIIVRSDSISLSFMNRCKLTSSRISRYIHKIMANDITIEYIKGSTDIFAHILSRIPRHNCIQSIDTRERNEVTIMKLKFDSLNLSGKCKRIKDPQERDPILSEIKKKTPKIEEAGESKVAISDDLLYKLEGIDVMKWKIYVPASIDEEIIMAVHRGMGHSGAEIVSLTIRENIYIYIKHLARKARVVSYAKRQSP